MYSQWMVKHIHYCPLCYQEWSCIPTTEVNTRDLDVKVSDAECPDCKQWIGLAPREGTKYDV